MICYTLQLGTQTHTDTHTPGLTSKPNAVPYKGQHDEVMVPAVLHHRTTLVQEGKRRQDTEGGGEADEQLGGIEVLQVEVNEGLKVPPEGAENCHQHQEDAQLCRPHQLDHVLHLRTKVVLCDFFNVAATYGGLMLLLKWS